MDQVRSVPHSVIDLTDEPLIPAVDDGEALLVSEEKLRRWLMLLRQPDRLGEGDDLRPLLAQHNRLSDHASAVDLSRQVAELVRDAIASLEPAPGAPREEALPYEVLTTCFLDGAKRWQAANKLGLSERQMSRERTRAIRLLKAVLETPPRAADDDFHYHPEPIPAIFGFVVRPVQERTLREHLDVHRLVRVHGPPGVGKTSLVADVASAISEKTPTLWYRFRASVNDTAEALLFELGEYLRSRRHPELATYIANALPSVDTSMAMRLALKGLADAPHLLVLDDCHVVDDDIAISGLLEEAIARLHELRIVLIGRYREGVQQTGISLEIPPFTRVETRAFLTQLGIQTAPQMAAAVHKWTAGIPQLVKLAASWLKTASEDDIAGGMEAIGDISEAQAFFLNSITDLMGPDERVILEAASIFRHRFTDDALAFVAERTRGEVQDTSRWLVRAYVATRSRNGDVAFFHNSVRDHVYERLSADRRTSLHERATLWYERQNMDDEAAWHRARLS